MDKQSLLQLGPALDVFLAEFEDVAIAPTRKLIAAYLRGQLGPLERKSVMPMAREAGIAPRTLQELLSLHRWDEDLLAEHLQRRVARAHPAADNVLTLLETWCPKKGDRTPGVALQRVGAGKRPRNGVLLFHLGFADADFNCLLDSDLYLPESWAGSSARRSEARIPDGLKYRTRSQIALDLIDRAARNGVRFGWIYAGLEFAEPAMLKELATRGYRYLVPRAGPKESERAYSGLTPWVTNVDGGPGQEGVIRAARIAEDQLRGFADDRKAVGLDHFEVRSYLSLKRHLALSAASLLFLKERTRRGRPRPEAASARFRAY